MTNILSFLFCHFVDGNSLEFTLYPVENFREAVNKGFLTDVISTLISACNPKHLQKLKGIDVDVSTREKLGIYRQANRICYNT